MKVNLKMGYVRVSSKDQNELRQVMKMRDLGIEEKYIFVDKKSGKDFDRPEYQKLRLTIREGDLIYIDSLDRLGRDYEGIIKEWHYITRELNADIIVLEKEKLFDSRKFKSMGAIGKLMEDQFLSLLSYVAEQERLKIKVRQAEGIAVAKSLGVKLGRPKVEIDRSFKKVYKQWKDDKITGRQAMKQLEMSKNTFYRRVAEHEASLNENT